ncbi:MAG: alpha/beta hydrolase [Novosphingobium sp.]
MNTAATLANDPAAIVAEIEGRARRVETPCADGTMAWRIWGSDTGRAPVVLGHGAQGAWSHWIRNIDALVESGRLVIAADLPGHGDSDDPETPDHAGISAVLVQGLREILGPGRQVDLVGFSFGGVAFSYFAASYPELVRRVIIVGCGGLDTPDGHVNLQRVGGLQGEERRAALKSNLLGLMLHHPESADDLAIHLLVRNAKRSTINPQELVLPDKLALVLPDVPVPVDAIWGELDRPHPDPRVQEEVIRRSHPDTDFRVIADAGHWAMYERPEAFNATLLAMLDKRAGELPC